MGKTTATHRSHIRRVSRVEYWCTVMVDAAVYEESVSPVVNWSFGSSSVAVAYAMKSSHIASPRRLNSQSAYHSNQLAVRSLSHPVFHPFTDSRQYPCNPIQPRRVTVSAR